MEILIKTIIRKHHTKFQPSSSKRLKEMAHTHKHETFNPLRSVFPNRIFKKDYDKFIFMTKYHEKSLRKKLVIKAICAGVLLPRPPYAIKHFMGLLQSVIAPDHQV